MKPRYILLGNSLGAHVWREQAQQTVQQQHHWVSGAWESYSREWGVNVVRPAGLPYTLNHRGSYTRPTRSPFHRTFDK